MSNVIFRHVTCEAHDGQHSDTSWCVRPVKTTAPVLIVDHDGDTWVRITHPHIVPAQYVVQDDELPRDLTNGQDQTFTVVTIDQLAAEYGIAFTADVTVRRS